MGLADDLAKDLAVQPPKPTINARHNSDILAAESMRTSPTGKRITRDIYVGVRRNLPPKFKECVAYIWASEIRNNETEWVNLLREEFQGPFTAGKLKLCIEKVVALAKNKIVLNAVGDLE